MDLMRFNLSYLTTTTDSYSISRKAKSSTRETPLTMHLSTSRRHLTRRMRSKGTRSGDVFESISPSTKIRESTSSSIEYFKASRRLTLNHLRGRRNSKKKRRSLRLTRNKTWQHQLRRAVTPPAEFLKLLLVKIRANCRKMLERIPSRKKIFFLKSKRNSGTNQILRVRSNL